MGLGEIDSRRLDLHGVVTMLYVDPDPDSEPSDYGISDNPEEEGGYSREDAGAFARGEWRYVELTLRLVGTDIEDHLGSVEWGRAPSWDRHIGTDEIVSDHVPDMLSALRARATEARYFLSRILATWEPAR